VLIDFEHLDSDPTDFDLCIVGAGAAGLTLATAFLDGPLRVAIIESGGLTIRDEDQDLSIAEVVGLSHDGVHTARVRAVGGTTTRWGGQALPFLDEDFRRRPWLRDTGWPIDRKTLDSYYIRAAQVLGLDERETFDLRPWSNAGLAEPAFSSGSLRLVVSRWSRHPDLGARYLPEIRASRHVTLIHGATVTGLQTTAGGGAVGSVTLRSLGGRSRTIRAKAFILAGGAIETCRLLLASNTVDPRGIGNQHGLVGQAFQDHVAAIVGLIEPTQPGILENLFDPFYRRGYKYLPRLVLDPARAAKQKLLHASLQILSPATATGPLGDLKTLAGRLRAGRLDAEARRLGARLLLDPALIFRGLWRRLVQGRGVTAPGAALWLEVHSEQEPSPESRITLSEQCDSLGMPRVRLDWRLTEKTGETIRYSAMLARDEFRKAGLGEVILDDWVTDPRQDWRAMVGDVYHQCGGARMALTPDHGVVDPDCRVFGVENLYLASSAVFPTSSFSNPTLTMMALALRLSDHLKARSATAG
jgi:choline dehydrogenase-like flavoprotein